MAGPEPEGERFEQGRGRLVAEGHTHGEGKNERHSPPSKPIAKPPNKQRIKRKPRIAGRYPNHNWVEPGSVMAVEPQKQVGVELVQGLEHGAKVNLRYLSAP